MSTIELVGGPLCGTVVRNQDINRQFYTERYCPDSVTRVDVTYVRRDPGVADAAACRPLIGKAGHRMYDFHAQR